MSNDLYGTFTHINFDHRRKQCLDQDGFLQDRPLEPNMVITVEPGLYFNDTYLKIWTQSPGFLKYFDMEQVERYRAVGGVRIEDTLLITANGYENLTASAPKQIHEIEHILASKSPHHHHHHQ